MSRAACTLLERVERCIERLDARIARQILERGSDAPHCVSVVGVFHTLAGSLERHALGKDRLPILDASSAARRIGLLRRVVRDHAVMVAMRGRQLAAREKAKRGA